MKTIQLHPLVEPITTRVAVPGCISYTIRALTIASMTEGSVRIDNPTKSDDSAAMVTILRTLGIRVEEIENVFIVHGSIKDVTDDNYVLDVNISGRTARSVLALLCIVPGTKILTCKEAFKKRPVGDLVEGLRQLGATIAYLEKEGYLPVKILSSSLHVGNAKMKGNLSSQYFSAIMMIAPLVGEITIDVIGEQSSKPFIDVTIATMKAFGVEVINENYQRYLVKAGSHYTNPGTYLVEADAIAATYFWSLAAITKSTIRVLHLSPESTQGDVSFVTILESMGCRVLKNKKENWIEVTGTDTLVGVSVDMNATPDSVMSLAIVAAFAKGNTIISNIAHLKIKETNRLEATKNELVKMGIVADTTKDTLVIQGGSPKPAIIETYGDHRIAMSFAIAGSKIAGIQIENPDVVSKAFPTFWETLNSMGIKISLIKKTTIVLIGMRGSGKTTIARKLANKLGKTYVDLDHLFVERVGMSIPDFVKHNGWDAFREKESALVQEVATRTDAVIATGGGVVLRKENIDALKQNGVIVFLKVPIAILLTRIGHDANRPSLTSKKTPKEEIELLWQQRKDLYEQSADVIIDTPGKTKAAIVEMIVQNV